jgi:hypothetical protein
VFSEAVAQTAPATFDPAVVIGPGTTALLGQGLLGLAVLLLLWVVWYIWKELKSEREKCMTAYGKVLELGSTFAASNSDVARALEERNRITTEMVHTNARLGDAVDGLSRILELYHRETSASLLRLENK